MHDNLRSYDDELLIIPYLKHVTFAARVFIVCGPRLWNPLPTYIWNIKDIDTFKSKLKTYTFEMFVVNELQWHVN